MKTSPFTRTVTVPKRDATTGEILLDADKKPIDGELLGAFTFKRPTLREELMISTRLAELTGGQKLDTLPARAADLGVMLSELPVVVTKAPDNWSWDSLQGDPDFYKLVAIWDSYVRGRAEITGAKPAAPETQEPASSPPPPNEVG